MAPKTNQYTIEQQRMLIKAHELVAIYNMRRPENFSTLDSGRNIPRIVANLHLLDPSATYRRNGYGHRSAEALNLRLHSQRASEVRRGLDAMVAAACDASAVDHSGSGDGRSACLACVFVCFFLMLFVLWLCNRIAARREEDREDRYRSFRHTRWY